MLAPVLQHRHMAARCGDEKNDDLSMLRFMHSVPHLLCFFLFLTCFTGGALPSSCIHTTGRRSDWLHGRELSRSGSLSSTGVSRCMPVGAASDTSQLGVKSEQSYPTNMRKKILRKLSSLRHTCHCLRVPTTRVQPNVCHSYSSWKIIAISKKGKPGQQRNCISIFTGIATRRSGH
jgi:hypothetical protein